MCPTDFLLGEWNVWVSLCFRPWRELGRGKCGRWVELAGEFGTLELGELLWEEFPVEWGESDCEQSLAVGGERGLLVLVGEAGRLSAAVRLRVSDWKLRLGVRTGDEPVTWWISALALLLLSLRRRDARRFLSECVSRFTCADRRRQE